jgi:CubicO group peptidase (beta-lactamase class C family)
MLVRHWMLAGFIILVLSVGGVGMSMPPERLPPPVANRIDGDVKTALRRFGVPGAAVMVIQNGRISFSGSFGLRDIARRLPVQTDTPFEIGSITKQFTAASILQLQEAGKLNLDDPVSSYLPDTPHAKEVSIRELLSHTSGLHDYFDTPQADQLSSKPISYDELMARIAPLPLDFTPGSRWSYSNTGYQILGRIIEKVSGQTYTGYVRRHILDPLHMGNTHTTAEEDRLPSLATGYRHVNGKVVSAPPIHADWGGAAGLLVSTVKDLSKWDAALRGGEVVSMTSYMAMTTPAATSQDGNVDYGLGLFVDSLYDQPRIGHTGGTNGSTTADEYFPRQGVRIIAFTNLGDGTPEAGETLTNIVFADLYPAIAAKAQQPVPGENPTITQTVRNAFQELQAGAGYARFSAKLQGKLSGSAGARLAGLLAPYGEPTAETFKGVRRDAQASWCDYVMQFGPGVSLPFSVVVDQDGEVASFSVG